MRLAPAWYLVMSLVSAVACQSGRGNGPLSTTTDSAGITIVTNFGPEWGEGEGWRLTPTLDLGGVADPGPEEFSRIAAIRRLGSSPDLCKRLGESGRRAACESFDRDKICGRFIDHLEVANEGV